jgi:hypothetical protein
LHIELDFGGIQTMTDWSAKMAAKLRNRNDTRTIDDAKFVKHHELIQELGPEMWEEVQNQLSEEGNALCADVESDVISSKSKNSSELILTANLPDGTHTCEIAFHPVSGEIKWKRENCSRGVFELSIAKNGKLSFFSGNAPVSANYVAINILESLLR